MRKTIIAATLLLASTQVLANQTNNFSYDYIEARIGASPFTFGAAMTKSIHQNAHLSLRADSQFEGDFDAAFGLGFHAPLNNWADVTGNILLRAVEAENTNNTDTGVELNLGLRHWFSSQVEIGAHAGYFMIDDNDHWLGNVYSRFHLTDLFSLGAEVRINDFYDDQLMFTARFKF